MGSTSTHAASAMGGTALGAAVLTILTEQLHFSPGLASAWVIILATIVGGPLIAWLNVRAQGDPALKAALAALAAGDDKNPPQVETGPGVTTVVNPPALPAQGSPSNA